jgi:hypothetical protein
VLLTVCKTTRDKKIPSIYRTGCSASRFILQCFMIYTYNQHVRLNKTAFVQSIFNLNHFAVKYRFIGDLTVRATCHTCNQLLVIISRVVSVKEEKNDTFFFPSRKNGD